MLNTSNKNAWWKPGMIIFAKVSASVAIPVILALYIGRYFDNKYDTTPWIFLSLTGIAFMISLFSIWKSLTAYINKIEKEEAEKKEIKLKETLEIQK